MNNSDVLALVAADNRARILEARRSSRRPGSRTERRRRLAGWLNGQFRRPQAATFGCCAAATR